jgi:hypothetical protein
MCLREVIKVLKVHAVNGRLTNGVHRFDLANGF